MTEDNIRASRTGLDAELQREIDEALGGKSLEALLDESGALPAKPARGGPGRPGPGSIVPCRIVAIDRQSVLVEMGGKDQGYVPLTQFDKPPPVGDIIQLEIVRYDGDEDMWVLSRQGAVERATWDDLKDGQIVDAFVEGLNKGGLEVRFNAIRAFMPISQISLYRVEDASEYLGKKIRCQVVEVHRGEKRVIVSARAVLELEEQQKREQLMAELKEGDVRDGIVRQVMAYGAFVDLGGVDGLVHVSQMSYARVENPADLVQPGQKVQVKVLKIDKEANRISLGMKQIMPDPWQAAENKYAVGTLATVKVLKLEAFGAFAELEPGLEGLIPVSEMSWMQRVRHPSDVLAVGQMVQAAVLSIDAGKRRLSLSVKQVQANPWAGAAQRFALQTEHEGKVTRIVEFGAFVELEPGVEGLIHISQLSDQRVKQVGDVVQVGQTLRVRVLETDEPARRISLTLKGVLQPGQEGAAATPAGATPAEAGKPKKRKKPLRGGLE